jgi:hypothetical protein
VAEEDLALEGDGAQVEETAAEQQTDETPEPIANLARDLGWTPKEEWHGEPEKWKPAEQFIRDGREIQQTTSRELRALREQMDRVAGVTSQIVTDKVAERDAYWKAQFNQAVEDGDTEAANKLLDQRPAAKVQTGADPSVASWVAKNEWFNKDPLAQTRAQELSNKLAHLPVPEQLAQVERAIRKEFPEHFPAPAKQPPATQTGSSRAAAPGNRVKGFADMPAASQQAALEFERLNKVPKEDFARSYWAQEAKKGSRA